MGHLSALRQSVGRRAEERGRVGEGEAIRKEEEERNEEGEGVKGKVTM